MTGREEARRRDWRRLAMAVVLAVVDMAIVNLCFLAAFWLRFYQELGVGLGALQSVPVPPLGNYLKALIILNYASLTIFYVSGLYDLKRQRTSIDIFYLIFRAISFTSLLVISLTYFFREFSSREGFSFSRAMTIYYGGMNITVMFLWRWLFGKLVARLKAAGRMRQNLVIIGANEMTRVLAERITANPGLGLNVIGYVDGGPNGELDEALPYLGSREEIGELFRRREFHEAVVVDQSLGHYELLELVSFCELNGIRITMIPTVYDLIVDYAEIYELEGIPVVSLQERPVSDVSLAVKRIFDLVLASVLLVIFLPLMLIIALAIRIGSPGPVIFRQERVGQDGKRFNILKFRTMVVGADQQLEELLAQNPVPEPVFKLPNDPRTTRLGRFLRKSSLDELPQLWNVLRGDMSFVGPRPEETKFVDRYDIWQRRRLKVKPGITGLQQIKCRGTLSLAERVRYDVYYVRKRSLLMDIWILLKTIPVVLSGKGAS